MLKYPNLNLMSAECFLITRRLHVVEARVLLRVYDFILYSPVYLYLCFIPVSSDITNLMEICRSYCLYQLNAAMVARGTIFLIRICFSVFSIHRLL